MRKEGAQCLCTCHNPAWDTVHMTDPCCDEAKMVEKEED